MDEVSRKKVGEQNRRKLIFLWPYTTWGGVQVYFFAIMKLARADWDVIVILPNGSSSSLLALLDDLEVSYEFADIRADPKPEPTIVGKMRRQYERVRSELNTYRYLRRFDLRNSILHIDVSPSQSWQLLTALALRGTKTFVTIHNFRPEISHLRALVWRARLAMIARLPGLHIFTSNFDTKEQLKQWIPRSSWRNIKVANTGVDPLQIESAALTDLERNGRREMFGLRPNEFVVLAAGQFVDRKGRWVLLDTAAKIKRMGLPIRFVWLMPEGIDDQDRTKIKALDLGDSFVPLISDSIGTNRIAILEFFQVADVFALPSLIEGIPTALLEAMALGIPSISTNVYAIPEALKDGETGLLIEPNDSSKLYDAILRLYNDSKLRSKLAEGGREFIRRNFDERDMAAIYLESYDDALPNNKSANC